MVEGWMDGGTIDDGRMEEPWVVEGWMDGGTTDDGWMDGGTTDGGQTDGGTTDGPDCVSPPQETFWECCRCHL